MGRAISLEALELVKRLSLLAGELASVRSFDELGAKALDVMEQAISVQYTGLFLVDPETAALKIVATRGFTDEEREEAQRTAEQRHPGAVVRSGTLLHVPDTDADPTHSTQDSPRRRHRIRSRLFVPVMSEQRCVGAYGLGSTVPHSFSELHIEMLSFAANLSGAVYASIAGSLTLRRQLERLSAQQAELAALSSPILEVGERTLALPLIGTIDRSRAMLIAEKLLGAIVELRARIVIFDFTGTAEVSADSLHELQRILHAVELLGSRCLLTGLSASLARQLAQTTELPARTVSTLTLKHALANLVGPQRRDLEPRS